MADNPFSNGLRLVYSTASGSENTGLTDGNTYYVVNKSGDSFQLSNSNGGSAISLTASADDLSGESHSLGGVTCTVTPTVSAGVITALTINDQGTLYDGTALPLSLIHI